MKDFIQGISFLMMGVSWLVYGHSYGIIFTRFAYITMFLFAGISFIAAIIEGTSK